MQLWLVSECIIEEKKTIGVFQIQKLIDVIFIFKKINNNKQKNEKNRLQIKKIKKRD